MAAKTSPPKPPDRDASAYVGPYRLGSAIASGASGRVFRAVAPDGSDVALKVFEESLRTESTASRFKKEAAIRIEHPNIVRVLDAGDDSGTPYIALELLSGKTLTKRIRGKERVTIREVVDIGIQVCRGLEAAHAMGVVHRDLKPENLFWCESGTIKLLDFGIALWEQAPERITSTGIVIGTPWYLSPEQARGERRIDLQADLWSLGVVLYEALSGTTPFERRGGLATVLAILQEEFAPLAKTAPLTPAPLATIVERCLVKEKRFRWSSATALRQALEEVDLDAAPAGRTAEQSRTSIVPGEQRVVAVLLAEGTKAPELIEQTIEKYRGTYLPLYGKRAVGLFGGSSWEGDEVSRAALSALELRTGAARLAIAAGHATSHGASISGEALMAAEDGCKVAATGRSAMNLKATRIDVDGAADGLPLNGGLDDGTEVDDGRSAPTTDPQELAPWLDGADADRKDEEELEGDPTDRPPAIIDSDVVPAGTSAPDSHRAGGRAPIMVDTRTGRLLDENFKLTRIAKGHLELVERRDTDMPAAYYPGGLSIAPAQPLFDREDVLKQVQRALRHTLHEHRPSSLLLVGPTGIGKTRLREETERRFVASSPGATLLLGRADTLGQARSFAVIAQALERRARQLYDERDLEDAPMADAPVAEVVTGDALRRAAIRELVSQSVPNEVLHQETLVFLCELLGIDQEASRLLKAARSDPQLMSDRIRMAMFDTLLGMTERGPLGIFLEDVHWADDESAKLLDELRERGLDRPIFLLATARPPEDAAPATGSMAIPATDLSATPANTVEVTPEVPWAKTGVEVIRLQPLRTRSAAALARHAGKDKVSKEHIDAIVKRCGGNPLFIEQMVFELQERSASESVRPPADDDESIDMLPLPLTVEAAVQSRLDRLPAPEKDACKRAAVFRRAFAVEELVHVGVADAQAILDSLVLRSIVTPRSTSRVGASREYRFRVQVFSDVAYGLLADDFRASLHRRAAEALEDLALGSVEEVALHYERGGEPRLAGKRYAEATREANSRGDGISVLRCSRKAFGLAVDKREYYSLHLARADALQFMGRFVEQQEALSGAEEHAHTARQTARVFSERIGNYWRTGQSEQALKAADDAAEKAHLACDPDLIVMTASRKANVLAFVGELDKAAEALTVASLETDAEPRTMAFLAAARATVASLKGELDERLRWNLEAAKLHSLSGDLRRGAVADGNVADSLSRLGEFGPAIVALERACERATRVNEPNTLGFAYLNLSHALSESFRFEEAEQAVARAADTAQRMGNRNLQLLASLYRAKVALRAGDLDLAAGVAKETADDASQLGRKNEEAKARTTYAQALFGKHEITLALKESSLAVQILEELGSLDEDESETFLIHATLLAAANRLEDARNAASRGTRRVREMAEQIKDSEKREAFLQSVSSNRAMLELADDLGVA